MGGHHWIIEGNTVRQVNSVGIEVGGRAYEGPDAPRRTTPDLGHNIVRRNRVSDCGTAGMRGLGVSHALVEDNDVVDCGWQDAEFHWEVAGIKLLVAAGRWCGTITSRASRAAPASGWIGTTKTRVSPEM